MGRGDGVVPPPSPSVWSKRCRLSPAARGVGEGGRGGRGSLLRAALVEFYPELVETFQLLDRWCPGSRGGRGCCRGCCRPRRLLPSTGPGSRPPTRRRTTCSRGPSYTWPSSWTWACPSTSDSCRRRRTWPRWRRPENTHRCHKLWSLASTWPRSERTTRWNK